MKNNCVTLFTIISLLVLNACSNGISQPSALKLDANEFAERIDKTPDAQVLDVRTPEEFSKGHLKNAINIDWNGNDFDKEIKKIDKNKPVFVYCLSGGRSGEAAAKMRADGYKQVYEMNGGMMKWRAAKLPESNSTQPKSKGMTKAEYDALLNTDKMVLIDFYADWCAPCKRMAPYLEEMKNEMKDRLVIVRINADNNASIANELKVDGLPTLLLYQNKKQIWNHVGFINKRDLMRQIE